MYLMISLNVCSVIRDGIGDTKVDQFQLTTNEDKICRLQVRMDDLLLVNDVHCLQHL